MGEHVDAVMRVIEQQSEPDRAAYFGAFADDLPLFTVEVLNAYVGGELDLPDALVRQLLSALSHSGDAAGMAG